MSDSTFFDILFETGMSAVVMVIVFYVLLVVALWKIFTKAGEAGWKSIIPAYNIYVMYKISWEGKWFLIDIAFAIAGYGLASSGSSAAAGIGSCLSLAALIINLIGDYKLCKAFGHGIGYTIGFVLFPNIFLLILGLGGSEYQGRQ